MRRALHLVLLGVLTASVAAAPVVAVASGTAVQSDATGRENATCTADAAAAATDAGPSAAAANDSVVARSAVGYRLVDLDSREDLSAAAARGDLEPGRVAVSDVLVLTLRDDALAADLGAGNATSAFLARTNGSTAPLVVRQQGTCRPPKHLVLGETVTRVVAAPDDGAVHVVVDLANATMRNAYETESVADALRTASELYVNATVRGGNQSRSVERSVQTFRREATLRGVPPGGPAFRTAAANATVAVDTNLASGREPSLVLRRPDGDVVASAPSTVDDEGVANATVSLADVAVGTRLTLSVTVAGRNVLDGPDEVRVVEDAATVDDVAVDERAQSVAVTANVAVGAGGFLVLHAGNASGPVVGHSGYLAPGEHDAVTAYVSDPVQNGTTVVAVPHVDEERNRAFDGADSDPRYTGGDVAASVVVADASLPAPGTATAPERDTSAWTTTPSSTTTPATTTAPPSTSASATTTTARTGATSAGSTGNGSSDPGGPIPGFGAVLAALAVLATVAVAARRH